MRAPSATCRAYRGVRFSVASTPATLPTEGGGAIAMAAGLQAVVWLVLLEERRNVDVDVARARALAPRPGPSRRRLGTGLDPAAARPAAEAGRDGGDAHVVAHRGVDHCAEDHVRVRVRCARDDLGGLVDLEQAELRASGDVQEDPGGAVERRLEQRRG